MQTISVKSLAATNTKPARIKAMHEGNTFNLVWSRKNSFESDAIEIAAELKKRLHWTGEMVGGHHKDGMVFVFSKSTYIVA